ncbi:MAG: diguanylate cyclase [Peptococcaceae bacterium]|nr:diguanylate cyclase [Peptococcaceae bacterium]
MLDFFIWLIHSVSLISYSFLLVVFAFSKKDKLVKIAILMVALYMIWTTASLFMRFDLPPGTLFWNRIMAAAIIFLPLIVYHFMALFSDFHSHLLKYIGYIGTAVSLILNFTGQMFSQVTVQMIPQMVDGRLVPAHYFDVKWEWGVVFAFMYAVILLAIGFAYCLKVLEKTLKADGIKAIIAGNVIIVAAIILMALPWLNQYSLGVLAGVINAVCIMISIYKYRMLEFKFVFKKGAALLFCMGLLVLGYIYLSLTLDETLKMYVIPAVTALSICGVYSLYVKFNRDIDKIFISTEYQQRQWLFGFSVNLANKLELDEITDTFLEAVKSVLRVSHVFLALYDRDNDTYTLSAGALEVAGRGYVFAGDNPMATWLNDNNTCLTRDHIRTLPIFKALWDSEMECIDDMDLELAVPLKSRSHLIGMLILSKKQDGSTFTIEDMDLLLSLGGSTAVALDNAFSYERAKSEANTDSLTGLFNHRHFYRELRQQIQEVGENPLSLVLLDLDMFKLYNDMYGHVEGDKALETVAAILKAQVGDCGVAARYGGEEFVIILPFYDSERAEMLTEKIRQAVQRTFHGGPGDAHRFLSISAGICTYPQAAPNGEELLQRADIALYSAKNSGKNTVVIYGPNMTYAPSMTDVPVVPGHLEAIGDLRLPSALGESISHSSAIFALTATIETKDYYTYGHSQKVAEYASVLAAGIGLDDWHVKAIMEAALLHDIGKIGIPEDILKKVGRLTEDELEIMRRHVDMSVTIIKHLPTLQYVLPAVIGHHENWDGTGYPRNIRGEEIPISARCLAISDSFDAMTSTRPYRSGCSLDHALRELQEKSGTQFDPHLVDAFVELTQLKRISLTPLQ